MNKYDEIMEKIVVTEEMRTRILSNIKQTAPKAKSKILHLPAYRKYLPVAACLAILLIGATVIPNILKNGQTGDPLVYEQPGGIAYADNAVALSSYVGFPVNEISSLPFEATKITYLVYDRELAEISYANEEQTLYFRKSIGTEDNSGDFNTYDTLSKITIKDCSITIKGNDELYNLAIWNDGQYSYSIGITNGISQDELSVLIETLDW